MWLAGDSRLLESTTCYCSTGPRHCWVDRGSCPRVTNDQLGNQNLRPLALLSNALTTTTSLNLPFSLHTKGVDIRGRPAVQEHYFLGQDDHVLTNGSPVICT
jgi:hypothetical protein